MTIAAALLEDALAVVDSDHSSTGTYLRLKVCERLPGYRLEDFEAMDAERAALLVAFALVREREEFNRARVGGMV